MAKYKQGKYKPRNPQKYIGDPTNIIYRSSWEFRFMDWIDKNDQVISWSSECTIIPYVSPVDNRYHRYFVDFKMQLKNNSGEVKTYLVEIKPECQTVPPKPSKKIVRHINEIMTYGVNSAKWTAAEQYAKDRGYQFIILTETHLGIK